MPTYYSVVQYVPDALAGEAINIGVIACDENRAAAQFLNDWRRVRCFSGSIDIGFLRDFALRVSHQVEPMLPGLNGSAGLEWNAEYLRQLSGRTTDSIQLTPPRVSLESAVDTIDFLASWFLKESLETKTKARDKRAAVKIASDALTLEVAQRIGKVPAGVLRPTFPVEGLLETQVLDLVAATGKPLFGVQGISFEMRDLRDLSADLDAAKWKLNDVRQENPDLPIALVHLPPPRTNSDRSRRQEELYFGMRDLMAKLSVDFVAERDVLPWAHGYIDRTLTDWEIWSHTSRQPAY